MASSLELVACGCGRTVGPGWPCGAGGGGGGALVVRDWGGGGGGVLVGYFRAAAPAVREAFDAEEPIVINVIESRVKGSSSDTSCRCKLLDARTRCDRQSDHVQLQRRAVGAASVAHLCDS